MSKLWFLVYVDIICLYVASTGIWLSGSLLSESAVFFLTTIWNELINVQLDLWVWKIPAYNATVLVISSLLVQYRSPEPYEEALWHYIYFRMHRLVFWIDFQTVCYVPVNGPDFIHSSKMDVEKYYQMYFEVWTVVRNMGDQKEVMVSSSSTKNSRNQWWKRQ